MRYATMLLAVVVVLVAAPAWADFEAGLEAFDQGDYATALKELRPLAEQGDAPAQNTLAWMYLNGHGVPQDYAQAAYWFRRAAEQGFIFGQYMLGKAYLNGHGVTMSKVQAHMWFSLAAAQGHDSARNFRDNVLAEDMTPAQLVDAERLAREWKPKE